MFKKKEEPLEEPKDKFAVHEDYGYEEHYSDQYKFQQPFQQHQQQASPTSFAQMNQPQQISEKDLEVISAKLDTIKALLESLNQRVANLERIARE